MTLSQLLPAVLLSVATVVSSQADELVGTRDLEIASPERGRDLPSPSGIRPNPAAKRLLWAITLFLKARPHSPTRRWQKAAFP